MNKCLQLFVMALLLSAASCESLTYSDKDMLDELQYYGVPIDEHYSPATACWLNFLPGIGNFYLDQTGEGIGNLLLWPLSIFWGMPQAYIDAKVLNQKVTADYYRTRAGKERLEAVKLEGNANKLATPVSAPASGETPAVSP